MRRVHRESKNELRRTANELNDQGARLLKTLKAVLLQCGGVVTITSETMLQIEEHHYFLDLHMSPEGLTVAVRRPDEDDHDPVEKNS